MGIRKRIKDFMHWCPQSPSRFPLELRSYTVPIAVVLVAALAFGVFLSLPSLQNVPTQPALQLPQAAPENSTQPSPTSTPATTATPTLTSTPTSTPVPSPPTITQTTAVNGSLELTVSIEKTVYSAGEPVFATFVITNISNQTFDFTSTMMNYDLIVSNETDSLVYDYFDTRGFSDLAWSVPISPGGNITGTLTWTQIYDTSPMNVPSFPSATLGTYYIVGESPGSGYRLRSEPLQILIVGS